MQLPITAALPDLCAALASQPNAILVAPPGAGKTTLVPQTLLEQPWVQGGKIIMLEPRRLAARAAATRIASLLGETVGQTAGFRTRLDSAISPATRIEVITEGLLVRRLLADPGLDGVACVIFDEIHERSLDADLALALCLDLQAQLRPELRLLAMSATADAERLRDLLAAPVITSEGRMFDVTIEHAARDLMHPRDLPEACARAIRNALAAYAGDILAFLPGMAEIRRTEAALAGAPARILPLHGDLPVEAQDLALRASDTRRVVLATSIAETSLTVPGVRIVVDGGFRRAPKLDPATGLSRLETLRISRAAATQRAGRAGREAPGVAIRLWSAAQHRGLTPFDRPEILQSDLAGLVLDCTAWGTQPGLLRFADPPPSGALAAATALLTQLGALDAAGRITPQGQRMAQLGAHPRLAAMMLAAQTPGEQALAADLAALLEERDPLRERGAAITTRLAALHGHDPAADRATLARIRQAARQYRSRLRCKAEPEGEAGNLLAAGFPDRIAQARGEPGSFRLAGGGSASLPATDALARAKLLVAAGLEQKASARITLAAPLDPEALPAWLKARCTEQVESGYDPASGAVFSRRRRRLGALILADRMVAADPAETAATLARVLVEQNLLPWDDAARNFQARVGLARLLGEDLPDLSDEALRASTGEILAPHLAGISKLAEAQKLDLASMLRACLSWEQARRLDAALPSHIELPGGRAAVDYTQTPPVAEARAQAFYGLDSHPRLAQGRVTLRLALLSPAGRPAAITGDLAAFWRGAWADARRDLRGRYPKHLWPERPWEAPAPKPPGRDR